MAEPLPSFRFLPDPVAARAVERSTTPCACCARSRGWACVAPVVDEKPDDAVICPWCVADGSATARFGPREHYDFYTHDGTNAYDVSEAQDRDEVCQRTPGFFAWQQEQWFVCCGTPAQYLGCGEPDDFLEDGKYEALVPLLAEADELGEDEVLDIVTDADPEGEILVHVFRCAVCRRIGGYLDMA